MPPKPKFSKEDIVAAALNIVSQKGEAALTARELGAALGSSARPIFTVFSGMEELQSEVRSAAMARFENMRAEAPSDMPIFKQVGMKMVLFGIKEPKLYQLLFMQENEKARSFDDVFGRLGATAVRCIETLEKDYALSAEQAKALFEHTWIHTFGIGALCATGACDFSPEQISQMLTQDFTAMMALLKGKAFAENKVQQAPR